MYRSIRIGSALAALALVAAGLVVVNPTTLPAAAAPGVPNAPTVVYSENFENAPDTGVPQLLTNYQSASPQYTSGRYTAAPFWSSAANCNGFIMASTSTYPAGACADSSASFDALRPITRLLGTIGGTDPNSNSAVAAYTAGSGNDGDIEFATVSQIALPSKSRYLTFSVDAAATNCGLVASTHPKLQFYVRSTGVADKALGGEIDPCTKGDQSSSLRGGHFPASGSFLSESNSVGIIMRNNYGSGAGNDGAFDNIQVLDGTPTLDKSFGTPNPITGVSQLTFTLTNTSDLATKLGWNALDTLAQGLVVASPANSATTCTNGAVTAAAGSGTINVSGDLSGDAAHLTSCTFTVDVVPSTPTAEGDPAQSFQNCASNLSNLVGVNPPASCATGSFPPVAQLAVAKTSTATSSTREGDIVHYSVTATNTGGSDYTADVPAQVTDDMSGAVDDATYNSDAVASLPGAPRYSSPNLSWAGALKVGEKVMITYSMTVTMAGDGVLRNVASVPGNQASGTPTATTSTTLVPAPAITLVKSASPSDEASFTLGRVITYSFVATNSGNLILDNPIINEVSFNGTGSFPTIDCPATAQLAPGAQMTCTAEYTVTQPDIDNHTEANPMNNVATSSATASNGDPVTSPESTASLPGIQSPALTVKKTAGPGGFTMAGQLVTYNFLITNTGNVTLTDAGVNEGTFTGSGSRGAVTCTPGAASMKPGAQETCTMNYTLTQADVDSGTVTNDATASATPPSGQKATSPSDTSVVTIPASPAVRLVKSAAPGVFTRAGDVVDYRFDITNSGNVTLGSLGITEIQFSGTGTMSALSCPSPEVAPGDTVRCTATYMVTQADVDSGVLTNSATGQGTPPSGAAVDSSPSNALVAITPITSLDLVKSIDTTVVAGAGQTVVYSFLVTNTGTVTVSNLSIADTWFSGTGTLEAATCPAGPVAPGASVTCSASYTTTSDDLAAGEVTNTATASAFDPSGAEIASDGSSARLVIDPVAAVLAFTGAALAPAALASAIGGLLIGLMLLGASITRRRQSLR